MSSISSVSARTLGDVIPGGLARSVALVLAGTALILRRPRLASDTGSSEPLAPRVP